MSDPFLVVGESLVDIVVPLSGEVSEAVGGSPMNVAVGLSRLGVPTVLITRIGDDLHGKQIAEHVRASGVELAETAVRPGTRTSTATARLDAEHVASYEFDLTWELEPHPLPHPVAGLHVGSLGASLLPGRQAVVDLARQAEADDVFVSYDPNIRPAFVTDREQAWHDVTDLARSCRLVKVSDEDLRVLRPGEPVDTVARELLTGATELVIVTHGGQGAAAYVEGATYSVPAGSVDVVDTVGAGDSFMAAALAILDEWELLEAGPGSLRALGEDPVTQLVAGAATAAAVTCSRRGANPPTRRELPPTWPAL